MMNGNTVRDHFGKSVLKLLLLSFAFQIAYTQTQSGRSGMELFEDQTDRTSRTVPTVGQIMAIALESTIDPTQYYVGPSDGIAVNVWSSPPLSFNLTVTPEGTLIVPTVGEIKVSNITLSEAKAKVLAEIKKKYIATTATVTLVTPRPIIISVTGSVLNPGTYTLTSIARADKALEEASKPTRLQAQWEVESAVKEMSTRNIILRHKDGTTSRVDIDKFLATRDNAKNPYLREGDIIIVPRKNIVKNVVAIYGEVNVPGRYEFVRGDSVKDLIRIAHGFTRLARVDSVEFSRLALDGTGMTTRILHGMRTLDGIDPDLPLEPGDRVVVRARVDLREDYRVSIDGEVLYPGIYPITKEKTRLSDAVRMAGGVTQFADLKSAELYRRTSSREQIEIERLLSARGGVPQEDSLYYFSEVNLRIEKEIVSVDFEKLLVQNDSTQDVILHSEDFINIPSLKRSVYVFGQVTSPGHIPFVAGQPASYYVNKAGGFTDRARTGDVRIIKARTKQWLSPDDTRIEDGDYVWVPKEIERPFIYYTTIVANLASIFSAIVGIAVVAATVGR
jgi:polysaccharide export outer membrane protein